MVHKKEFLGIGVIALVCLLLIAFYQKESTPLIRTTKPISFQSIQIENSESIISQEHISIEGIVNIQRYKLKRQLNDYLLTSNESWTKHLMETGGQPLRTVIITTWRAGSTFLGDIFNSLPGNYYHYEPLLDFGIIQIRGPPYADSALKVLKKLLKCDYTNLNRYLEFGMSHIYLFTHNTRLWNQCETYPDYCWNPEFLSAYCRTFPFQSLKIVRLRLKLAEELLNDESLNIKVILLIRDPRGTLQSRRHRIWCPGEPDCDQANYLCADMVSDYSAAIRLKKLYPTRFRALRYEDLSLNPYQITEDMFKFMGLTLHPLVKEFLDSHTRINVGGVSSTYRDSKNAPFHWRNDLNYTEVQLIEESCKEAMDLWGYVRTTSSNYKDVYPLTQYDIN